MRELKYRLSNGTIVTTLEATKGQSYEVVLVEEEKKHFATPKQLAMRFKCGKVAKN